MADLCSIFILMEISSDQKFVAFNPKFEKLWNRFIKIMLQKQNISIFVLIL
jgi:translation elongation factor EF-Ts